MCYTIATMKMLNIFIAVCLAAVCGCAQESPKTKPSAATGEQGKPPTLEEYKQQIYAAGGTGVHDAIGVDTMLADGLSPEMAAGEVGEAIEENVGGIRIAAWNLRWFPAGFPLKPDQQPNVQNEAKRTGSVARFIRRERADIVLLEEIRNREVLDALVTNEALKGWTVNAISDFPMTENAPVPIHQNAIISKYRTVDAGFAKWRRRKGIYPPRGYVWSIIDTGSTNLIGIVGVHLKSNYIDQSVEDKVVEAAKNTKKREESAQQLVRFAESLLGKEYNGKKVSDVFVGGDFNTSYNDSAYAKELTLQTMKDGGYVDTHAGLPEAQRYTMPRSRYYPPTTFDYLFHKGVHVTRWPKVAIPQYTSDHCLLSVVLTDEVSTEKVKAAKLEPLEFDLEDADKIIDLE